MICSGRQGLLVLVSLNQSLGWQHEMDHIVKMVFF